MLYWCFRAPWSFNVSSFTEIRRGCWCPISSPLLCFTIWRSKHEIIIKSTRNRQLYTWTNWPLWLWRWREHLWSRERIHPLATRSGRSRTPTKQIILVSMHKNIEILRLSIQEWKRSGSEGSCLTRTPVYYPWTQIKDNHSLIIYWPAKERLQNIDAICFIVKTKNSNCRTYIECWMCKEVMYSQNSDFLQKTMSLTKRPSSGVR